MGQRLKRRQFLAAAGAASALGALPARAAGALVAADDYLFAPGLVYLQTGSLGPTPRPVMERTIAAWRELERNPVACGYGAHEEAMEGVRAKAAAFLGCATAEIVLTRSTTDGMNWIAQGLALEAGDRVLTTDQEHPGGRACWDYLARRSGVALDVVAIPPGEDDAAAIVERFTRALTPRTRVLSVAHVLFSTGLRMPVAELSALARSRGALAVVDGAQAAGGIAVDVKALGCHAYATSGHKWLLGPKGTGLLYLSEDAGDRIDPIALQGGRKGYSDSSGFPNTPGIIGLGAALDYLAAIGMPRVEAHDLALRDELLTRLARVPKLRVVSPPPGPLASPLLTFALPDGISARELQQRLAARHGVVVKMIPPEWLNGNRVSTHVFNTPRDLDRLIEALKAELA